MLVITRREGEEVVIGDPQNPIGVVRIASIKGDRVRLAFDFPRTIDVHRREVANQILSGLAEIVVVSPPSDTHGVGGNGSDPMNPMNGNGADGPGVNGRA